MWHVSNAAENTVMSARTAWFSIQMHIIQLYYFLPYCQMDHQLPLIIYRFEMVKMLETPLERPCRGLVKVDLGVDYWIASLAGYSMKPFHQTKLHFASNQQICDRCGDGGRVQMEAQSRSLNFITRTQCVLSKYTQASLPKIRHTKTSHIQIRFHDLIRF